MLGLENIGEKIGDLVSSNLGDAAKEKLEGVVNASGDNSAEFNTLVQELIAKVTSKVGDVSTADSTKLEEAIQSVMSNVNLENMDKGKLVAAVKQGIDILKRTLGNK
ncbi:MAG: hypothetical protein IJ217_02660 [Clostridia bacterium]|nr:hypothetical protein [Clostridia bacterium]